MPTVLRNVRRERNEHCKSLNKVTAPMGGVYSRTKDTLRAPPRPTVSHTLSVRCDVGTQKYIARMRGNLGKLLHLGDKPRTIRKPDIEALGVILSAISGVDSGFAGTEYDRLGHLTNSYAPALLVMTLTDADGVSWAVAKHREYWAASRMAAKSRATIDIGTATYLEGLAGGEMSTDIRDCGLEVTLDLEDPMIAYIKYTDGFPDHQTINLVHWNPGCSDSITGVQFTQDWELLAWVQEHMSDCTPTMRELAVKAISTQDYDGLHLIGLRVSNMLAVVGCSHPLDP